MQTPTELSRRCDEHARCEAEQHREVIDVGPFRALLNPTTDMIWVNYAVPLGSFGQTESVMAALDDLRSAFNTRGRKLRFEFNALPWPGLAAVLEQGGLQLQIKQPLMVCTPETFTPITRPRVAAHLLDSTATDAEVRAYMTIPRVSFEDNPHEVTAADIIELRDKLGNNRQLNGLATLNGVPAGSASLSLVDDSAELGGVATDPFMRRRGVAVTLSSFLVREHFARSGRIVWLSAGDEQAEAVYQKVGFKLIDTRLNYIDPVA